jgi:short-subunit dehydrogenase
MLDVNVYQKGFLSRLLINKFYKRGSEGKKSGIVFLSSIQSIRSSPSCTTFSASSAFVTSLALSLGYEFTQENFSGGSYFTIEESMINVQCICPGPIYNTK